MDPWSARRKASERQICHSPVNFRLEGIPSETKPNVLAAQVNGTALDEVYVVAYGRQITLMR